MARGRGHEVGTVRDICHATPMPSGLARALQAGRCCQLGRHKPAAAALTPSTRSHTSITRSFAQRAREAGERAGERVGREV